MLTLCHVTASCFLIGRSESSSSSQHGGVPSGACCRGRSSVSEEGAAPGEFLLPIEPAGGSWRRQVSICSPAATGRVCDVDPETVTFRPQRQPESP